MTVDELFEKYPNLSEICKIYSPTFHTLEEYEDEKEDVYVQIIDGEITVLCCKGEYVIDRL